jgi:hypothetical protein
MMSNKPSLRALKLRQPGPVLVCRKCLKRMAGGGKLRKRLKASLKQRSAARLVLTNCFGICPKGAVVAASPATFARDEILLIRDCSEDATAQASEALVAR